MAVHLEISHTTTYKYANPVTFGPHRAMFLPRVTMRGRLLSWSATTSPPSKIRWVSDPLANNITVMEFSGPSAELAFMFQFRGVHYGARAVEEFALEPRAEEVPVQHTPDEWTDLGAFMRPHAEDHDSSVAAWAKSFTSDNRDRTTDVLKRMLDAFQDAFSYTARNTEGTQTPVDSDAKCNPVDSIGSSTKRRVSHSERRPSARFSRGQRRLGETEYRAPSVTRGVALRPRTQGPEKLCAPNRAPAATTHGL
jgi:transglutaminase-like putative cysteine protease